MAEHPLVAAAGALRTMVAERGASIEESKRIPEDIVRELTGAGFFRACMPMVYGGMEVRPIDLAHAIETLAEGDGATAWVAMICATTGVTAGAMQPELAAQVFAKPDPILCGVFARRGKAHDEGGHYRIEGRWQWGSGSGIADWITAGCVVYKDGQPQMGPGDIPVNGGVFVPISQAELHGDWDASGLCATESQDFSIRNARVPKSHMLSPRPLQEGALFRFPGFGLLASGVVSVMLGLARAAIEEAKTVAGVKIPEAHRRVLAQRSRTQEDVAEAEAMTRAARSFFHEMLAAAWDETESKGYAETATRRDLRMAGVHAARAATRAVDLMYGLGGGTSVYKRSPLQRIFRDVHVASQHMQVATPVMETVGRHMLALEGDYGQL